MTSNKKADKKCIQKYAYVDSIILYTSIVPALRAGFINNEKQWELYHLYQ